MEKNKVIDESTFPRYYIIAPIEGIHLDFDYHMYPAEIFGCPPNYKPNPRECTEFRHPYTYFSRVNLSQYHRLRSAVDIDDETMANISFLTDRKLSDLTCLAFSTNLDNVPQTSQGTFDQGVFDFIIEKGERLLDIWRLCVFRPGEDMSIGNFGAIGNGVQCFWIGENDT